MYSVCLCLVLLSLGAVVQAKLRDYCDDQYVDCQPWAERGECQSNTDTMNIVCGPSCGFVTQVPDDTNTFHDICGEFWTDQGRRIFLHHLEMNQKQPPKVPAFTATGVKHTRIPDELYKKILAERTALMSTWVKEVNLPGVIDNHITHQVPLLMTLSNELQNEIVATVKPMLEEWIGGKEIEHTYLFKLRRYLGGHVLHMHVDVLATHVVSAIMQIEQEVDKDWPLYIINNNGQIDKIVTLPGDLIFYESAKVIHGRPEVFEGTFFDSMFLHYRPVGWTYKDVVSGSIVGEQGCDDSKKEEPAQEEEEIAEEIAEEDDLAPEDIPETINYKVEL